MAHRDFREFLAVAEQHGLLRRVKKPVDRSWEPASMIKWAFQALSNEDRFGLLFENVEGSNLALCTGLLGASRQAYALALGVEADDINACWEKALLNPIKPVIRDSAGASAPAPCQEIVQSGDEVRLSELPVPTWTPGKDLGAFPHHAQFA